MKTHKSMDFVSYMLHPFQKYSLRRKFGLIIISITLAGSIWKISNLITKDPLLDSIILCLFFIVLLLWCFRVLYKEYILMSDMVVATPAKLYLIASKVIGLSMDSYQSDINIHLDGSMNTKYTIFLSAISREIDFIDHSSSLKYKEPTITEKLELIAWENEVNGIKIVPIIEENTETSLFWKMHFIPRIQIGQPPLPYYFEYSTPSKSFAINKQELVSRDLPFEYFLIKINYPTKKLNYRLTFERNLNPSSLTFDVWMGRAQIRNIDEYNRIYENKSYAISSLPDGKIYIDLDIDYPIQSLSYVIKWTYQK